MEYIKNAQKEIQEEWFTNHTAEIVGNDDLYILRWNEKGTNMYSVQYALYGNTVSITGDIGYAVFILSGKASLENLKEIDLNYFMKKLVAHSGDRWSFDKEKAHNELNEWYEEISEDRDEDELEDLNELHSELQGAIDSWDIAPHYEMAVFSTWNNTSSRFFDGEEADIVSKFGRRLPYRFIAYWVGLQMAIKQLEASEKITA